MRVAIVGGPGVGKSTLVRQLGDLYHNGAYGEGEQGVWDPRVLEDIEAGRNAVAVTRYFAELYDANYRDAAEHDSPAKVILFEGARISIQCCSGPSGPASRLVGMLRSLMKAHAPASTPGAGSHRS